MRARFGSRRPGCASTSFSTRGEKYRPIAARSRWRSAASRVCRRTISSTTASVQSPAMPIAGTTTPAWKIIARPAPNIAARPNSQSTNSERLLEQKPIARPRAAR